MVGVPLERFFVSRHRRLVAFLHEMAGAQGKINLGVVGAPGVVALRAGKGFPVGLEGFQGSGGLIVGLVLDQAGGLGQRHPGRLGQVGGGRQRRPYGQDHQGGQQQACQQGVRYPRSG
ncbi:MAG: hypothetical protein U5J82_01835 [Desulfobacterales bacterium]|nr:hypothetical protein [Desulfobacterales bacterium]